jgi:hypothetical protein
MTESNCELRRLCAFASILDTCIRYERAIESTRQVLAENLEFDPEVAFFRIDRGFTTRITPSDVRKFMKEN